MKWTFIKTLIYNKRVSNLNLNYKRFTFIVSIVHFRGRLKFSRYKILSWPDFQSFRQVGTDHPRKMTLPKNSEIRSADTAVYLRMVTWQQQMARH